MTQASPETSAPHPTPPKDTGPTAAPAEFAVPPHLQGAPEVPIVDPPKSATDAASAIESLDEQLAQLTAELLNPNASEPITAGPTPAAPSAPAATEPPPPIPQAAPIATAPPVQPAPIPTATVTSPPPAPPAATPAPAAAPTPTHPAKAPPATPAPASAEVIPASTPPQPSALLVALASISKPLATKPAGVRMAVGLIAVNTLLIAAALWAYIFFRPAPAPTGGAAFDFAKASLPEAPAEPTPEATKPEAKHEEAKPESGEGEGHEAAKAPDKKHKSPPKPPSRSAKKAAKPAAEEHE